MSRVPPIGSVNGTTPLTTFGTDNGANVPRGWTNRGSHSVGLSRVGITSTIDLITPRGPRCLPPLYFLYSLCSSLIFLVLCFSSSPSSSFLTPAHAPSPTFLLAPRCALILSRFTVFLCIREMLIFREIISPRKARNYSNVDKVDDERNEEVLRGSERQRVRITQDQTNKEKKNVDKKD